jgi:hypothetical protein
MVCYLYDSAQVKLLDMSGAGDLITTEHQWRLSPSITSTVVMPRAVIQTASGQFFFPDSVHPPYRYDDKKLYKLQLY